MPEIDPKEVMIAVPVIGDIDPELTAFMMKAVKYGFETRIFKNYTPMPHVQNVMATSFMKSEYKKLWMIDSDMVPRENIFSLLDMDADIVGPLYPRSHMGFIEEQPRVSFCAYRYKDVFDVDTFEDYWPEVGTGVQDVSVVGTGCMIVKRRVFEDADMVLGREWTHMDGSLRDDTDEELIPYFRNTYSAVGKYKGGNDVDFCLRARRLGYDVQVNTNVLCGHRKSIDLSILVKLTEYFRGRIPAEMFMDASSGTERL